MFNELPLDHYAGLEAITAQIQRVWREFWAPLLLPPPVLAERAYGNLDIEALKNELYDYWSMLQVVPVVYAEATGGRMSRPDYIDPQQIVESITEHHDEMWADSIADALAGAAEAQRERDFYVTPGEAVKIALDSIAEALDISPEQIEQARADRARVAALLLEANEALQS